MTRKLAGIALTIIASCLFACSSIKPRSHNSVVNPDRRTSKAEGTAELVSVAILDPIGLARVGDVVIGVTRLSKETLDPIDEFRTIRTSRYTIRPIIGPEVPDFDMKIGIYIEIRY